MVRREGFAYLVAVLGFCLLSAMGLMICDASILEVRKTQNHAEATSARYAAESGMAYMTEILQGCQSESVLSGRPDMIQAVYDHLDEKFALNSSLPAGWSMTKTSTSITSATIPIDDSQSFTFSVTVTQADDDGNPTEMKLSTTGTVNGCSRTVSVKMDIEQNKDILHHSIASMIRVIIRGKNTVLNGDIASGWKRVVNGNYPFDVGHRYSSGRAVENITINRMESDGTIISDGGRMISNMNQAQFNGEEEVPEYNVTTNSMYGIRHRDLRSQVAYDTEMGLNITHEDFDTTSYKNRPEASGGLYGTVGENEKVTLPYPISNHPMLATDASNYRDEYGNYLYGYLDASHNWIVYDKNPDGKWEFGYTDNSGNWIKVTRDPTKDGPIGKYSQSSGYIRMGKYWVTKAPPDISSNAKIICGYWANGVSYWRAFYKDFDGTDATRPKFKNLHIPMGSHAHFKNCTFTGITYVETDEDTDLSLYGNYDKYNKLRKDAPCGSGSGSTNTRSCNNVVFENCTFEGPVVSSVPKDMRYQQNSVMFIGNTTFNASAIRAELNGTTILMPNYNVNIGDFVESSTSNDSALVGVLVGGIVDIRDNALVKGTIISMANFDHVSDWSLGGWGANVGNWERSGEVFDAHTIYNPVISDGLDVNAARDTPLDFERAPSVPFAPSDNITVTPDPSNPLPYGMKVRYKLVINQSSYEECN
jgi:hypothetical protein